MYCIALLSTWARAKYIVLALFCFDIQLFGYCFAVQVGRALQPSVIYMGECEKMFKKKIPKTDLVIKALLCCDVSFSCFAISK